MDRHNAITLLRKAHLDTDFSEEDFDHLLSCSEEVTYPAKTYLTRENSRHNDLFILLEGSADICKTENNKEIVINTITAGQCFGEIAFFSNQPRTASIRTQGVVKTLIIKHDLLKNYPATYRKLELSAYRINYELVSNNNQKIAASIQKRMDFARIFTAAIIVLIISNFFDRLLTDYLHGLNVYSEIFSWVYLLILAAPCILIVRINKENLSTFGLTLHNGKKALREGLALSALVIVIFFSVAFFHAHETGQAWTNYIVESRLHVLPFSNYVVHATLQEFLRSIFYISLVELYSGKKILANFFGALVFSTLHIHFGYLAVLVTFIAGFLFNALQERHKTLLGIIAFHSLAGWAAFTVKLL